MSGTRGGSGFTLVEIAVTVTIVGIIVSIALPAMRELTLGESAGPLEPLRVLLVDARQRSAVSGSPVQVWLVPTSGRYRVQSDSAGRTVLQEGVLPLRSTRAGDPSDRFRVVFRPVGLGVSDSIAAEGVVLRVDAATGEIVVER